MLKGLVLDVPPIRPGKASDKGQLPPWLMATDKTMTGHSGLRFGDSRCPGPRHLRMGFKQVVPVDPAPIGKRPGPGVRNGTSPPASASASRSARRRAAAGPAPHGQRISNSIQG